MNKYEAIGFRINALCKDKGISKMRLADKIGVSYETILRVTRGEKSELITEKLLEIFWAFEMTAAEFFRSPFFDRIDKD
ncbi:MAG: helix-turn-helix transcriptional regulator [Clostridiales bacterium]|nr:helix-turn-helix transcriptional regulator [Clostridiales bacterium]